MKYFLVFLAVATTAFGTGKTKTSQLWVSNFVPIHGGYKAVAGPVWKSSEKTPDFYRISVEEKTAGGSVAIVEKEYPLSDVDWPRLQTTDITEIIKYHEPTARVGFFLKGPYATFVYTMPNSATADNPSTGTGPPQESSIPAQPIPPADSSAKPTRVAGDLAKAKRFVPSVVYNVKKGVRETKTKRWVARPLLEIVSKDQELIEFVTAFDAAVFAAAGPLPQGKGKVTVYIGPAKEVAPVRKKLLPQSGDSEWFYWSYWNPKREFTGALVFIVTDRMNAEEARRALARCLMGVSGFPDESREYRESILHPDTRTIKLAPIDERLISFIYKHTEPGIGRDALLAKMNTHWQ